MTVYMTLCDKIYRTHLPTGQKCWLQYFSYVSTHITHRSMTKSVIDNSDFNWLCVSTTPVCTPGFFLNISTSISKIKEQEKTATSSLI